MPTRNNAAALVATSRWELTLSTAPTSLTSSHLSPALLLASAHIFQTGARKRGNCELAHLFSRSIGLVLFPMALFPVVVFGDGKVLLLAAQC